MGRRRQAGKGDLEILNGCDQIEEKSSYVLVRHERRASLRDGPPAVGKDISLPGLVNDARYAFKRTRVVVGGPANSCGHLCVCEICCGLDSEIVGYCREYYDRAEEKQAEERQGNQECPAARHGRSEPLILKYNFCRVDRL